MNLTTVSINNWSPRKKIAAILLGILAIVGIIVTIYLVQRQQELRGRAEKSTTLTLTPPNQSVNPGEDASLDVVINPGVNLVNFVKFTVRFDPQKFDPGLVVFNVNESSPLETISDPLLSEDGQATFTLSIGSDATKVVREQIKLGTLLLTANDGAEAGETQVFFNEDETQVRSVQSTDAFNENVLSSTTPAIVTITGECRPNIGTCSWDPSGNATNYHYIVTNVDDNAIVVEGDIDAPDTQVEFPSVPGKTYRCEVTATNECGSTEPSEDQITCPVPSETPTPTPTGSPTPTPTGVLTPTETPTPTPSPSPTPTSTPTDVPTPTNTPTPTIPEEGGVETPTPTTPQAEVETPTPTTPPQGGEEATPFPTLPPTGSPLVLSGIIGGILFVLGGIFLLFL